ncbi:MAG: hypothetical protein BJ554DRAFT_4375, partial [Olpidium bornovanus]
RGRGVPPSKAESLSELYKEALEKCVEEERTITAMVKDLNALIERRKAGTGSPVGKRAVSLVPYACEEGKGRFPPGSRSVAAQRREGYFRYQKSRSIFISPVRVGAKLARGTRVSEDSTSQSPEVQKKRRREDEEKIAPIVIKKPRRCARSFPGRYSEIGVLSLVNRRHFFLLSAVSAVIFDFGIAPLPPPPPPPSCRLSLL